MELYIKSWAMWMPPEHNDDTALVPELKQVPPMTRRRLSKLTKLAFEVALQATKNNNNEPLPTVFASRHGDLHKTLLLLQQLGAGEALSPSQFALSVHNAISGQFSIYSQNQADSNAIAAGADSLHYAVLDAAARFYSEPALNQVLVVYADEPVPQPYQQFCQEPAAPVALALLLHRSQGQPVRFSMLNDADANAEPEQAMKLAGFLQAQCNSLTIAGNQRLWQWQRA
ncbi:MAG TPA: beta-ketoacyl synthase chain length factor [Rheinheimera sp.]|nr:beta-ketoacyl synthase chain length factor [Rheinheimera sp.]